MAVSMTTETLAAAARRCEEAEKFIRNEMKKVEEPDGSLLDNSVVFYSSELASGDGHTHDNLPVLVAGRGGKTLNSGRYIRYPTVQKVADLYISLLRTVGVNATTFGMDGTAPLSGLT